MKIQIKKQIGLVFFIILALITSSSFGNSAFLRDFGVDDVVVFGVSEFAQEETEWATENLISISTYTDNYEVKYNFTEVDDLLLEYTAERSYGDGYSSEITRDFSTAYLSDRMEENLFSFYYDWDENWNRCILTYFEIYTYYVPYFIEPNWGDFNSIFGEIINPEKIIDYVYHDAETEIITFGDFLDDILSFKILGASNISQAQSFVLNSTNRWTFEFDLSHSIYYEDYNPLTMENEYVSIPRYKYTLTFDYSEGGTLEKLEYQWLAGLEVDNVTHNGEERLIVQKGGLSVEKTSLGIYSVLFSLALIPICLYIRKRKKC